MVAPFSRGLGGGGADVGPELRLDFGRVLEVGSGFKIGWGGASLLGETAFGAAANGPLLEFSGLHCSSDGHPKQLGSCEETNL